ncbi:LPXTG cell wall anchor domain-containing protein [Georgenia wutianyii]|uniref:LPXTG cell wall anchor domain-containing protein n=1 Tax=Georgenia wutianyii TaxID=2585135 RepID=UPI0015D17505|nr:LPXTG cell wall anchor domain-containing protein [Georgenia wutianyii]
MATVAIAVAALVGTGTVAAADTHDAPAIDSFHPVAREAAAGLPDRTVYRPTDLAPGEPVPVLIWGNGGCRPANPFFMSSLMLIAARGFVVVADGAPEAPSNTLTGMPQPDRMIEIIDWLETSPQAHEQLGSAIADSPVAVSGSSCGGIEALVAGADPRVDTVISANSGLFETPEGGEPPLGYGRDRLEDLHTPTMFLDGGPLDGAMGNTIANYELATVPAVYVTNPQNGHGQFFYGVRLDESGDVLPLDGMVESLEEQVAVFVNWLDFVLNGNAQAEAYFLEPCGLCEVPGWSVESKGWDALEEPVEEPAEEPSAEPAPPPSDQPTEAPVVDSTDAAPAPTGAGAGALPSTGADGVILGAVAALVLLTAGGALAGVVRRRRSTLG